MIWLMAMKGLNSENVQHFIGLVSRSTVSILGVPVISASTFRVLSGGAGECLAL
jgi:hypothetical protein